MISSLVSSGRTARAVRSFIFVVSIALAGAALIAVPHADARMGGGGSFGSRGFRTFSTPSATPTAPSISSIQRSETQNFGSGSNSGFGAARPGLFGGGFGRGLVGGFLGAGLFGMLFGNGFGGGLGGGMSLIGLILQLGLLYFGFRFVMNLVRGRQSAFGGGMSSYFGGGMGNPGVRPAAAPRPQGTPITIGPDDYQTFERRLVESQTAYSNGDIATLRRVATPEMAGNFEQELAGNARQGIVNKLADVRLLQGDLSEAWREAGSDYATVAMRFSLIDATLDQRSGRLVSGNSTVPQTVTEVWTFARAAAASPGAWTLSAIQQA